LNRCTPCAGKYKTAFISTKKNRRTEMKKSMAWVVVGALSLGTALIAQSQQATGATEKAVAALEEKWTQAQRANNFEMAAPLLAEKYVGIDYDGKVSNRAESIAEEKATKYTSADIEDVHVTVFGDTAIARLVFKGKGTDETGKPFDSHSRWTDTWVKMSNGKWQCVASHGSRVKM
jgi:ketosteroid isomerase-like protein